jgi:hypothetical protein
MPDKFARFFSSNPGQGDGGEPGSAAAPHGAAYADTIHKQQG